MKLKSKILSLALSCSMLLSSAYVFASGANYDAAYDDECVLASDTATDKRVMENLNRGGFAATNPSTNGGGMYLSWRLLGTEPMDTKFNLYKNGEKLQENLENTSYIDAAGKESDVYTVAAVINGIEGEISNEFMSIKGQADSGQPSAPYAYFDIPINIPPAGNDYDYSANDASVGDVDGDGEYEIILKWDPSNSKDSAGSGATGEVYLDCYEYDGTQLWRIDLGRNIRAGAHYTQFQVFDYDGDGKAEVAVKTAPGSIDGKGNYVSDAGNTETIRTTDNTVSYLGSNGHVAGGPEYLTVFSGETGEALQTIDYDPPVGNVSQWGDSKYNRSDRMLAGTAYLDGVHPSMIFARGYYAKSVCVAYDWDGENITKRWKIDSADVSDFSGQGNHQLSVADLDGDGKDEIIYGGAAIDDNGTLMWSAKSGGKKLGHGDALHVSDFNNDGIQEVFKVNEDSPNWGRTLINGKTGEIIFHDKASGDDGRGVIGNFSPKYGVIAWDSGINARTLDGTIVNYGTLNSAGKMVSTQDNTYPNFTIFWDGDFYEEHFNGDRISKWYDYDEANTYGSTGGFGRLWTIWNENPVSTNNSSKNNPCLQADLFGDWREEFILRHTDNTALRVFTSLIPTEHKLTTFMHDSQYRCAVAWQNTAYNQPPHQSYYIGEDKTEYTQPDITVRDLDPEIIITVKTKDGVAAGVNVKVGDIEKPTSTDGTVSFRVPSGTYAYSVDQVGYLYTEGSIVLAEGAESVSAEVLIEEVPDSTVTVKSGDKVVSGATVTIGEQTVTTDSDGKAVVKLRAGEHDYTVSCHKYIDKSGKITVDETNVANALIELEAIEYAYDSDKDTDGSQFIYSGGDGAELSFDGKGWTMTQNSTDGGRGFGAEFDTSVGGNAEIEFIYKNGAQKDSSNAWKWADREYTHVIEFYDAFGNVIAGLSQEYQASGVQELKYYNANQSAKNVSGGTLLGGGSITKRSSIVWKINLSMDLKNKKATLTVTDEAGENGYVLTDLSLSHDTFKSMYIGTKASGNVTCAPNIKNVLYYSECIDNDYVPVTPTPAPTEAPSYSVTVSSDSAGSVSLIEDVVEWNIGGEPFVNADGSVNTGMFPAGSKDGRYSVINTSISNVNGLTYVTSATSASDSVADNANQSSAKTFADGYTGTRMMKTQTNGSTSNYYFTFTPDSDGVVKVYARSGSGSASTVLNLVQNSKTQKIELPSTSAEAENGSLPFLNANVTANSEVKIYGSSNTAFYAIVFEPSDETSFELTEKLTYSLTAKQGDIIKIKAESNVVTTPETELVPVEGKEGYYTFIMPGGDVVVSSKDEYAYTINSVIRSVSDGVNVNITKNEDTEAQADTLIVAAYDSTSGAMKNIGMATVDMASGATKDVYVELSCDDNDIVIAYVWNSLSDIKPLSQSFKK